MSQRSYLGQLLDEAREAFIDGHYQEAEPLLNQPTLLNSNNPEVYQMLARREQPGLQQSARHSGPDYL